MTEQGERTVHVTHATLLAGVKEFKKQKNWPKDFHARQYSEHSKLLAAGITEAWWSAAVDELARWIAIRPLSRNEIRRRGLSVLPDIKAAVDRLRRLKTGFGDAQWKDVAPLFEVASSIKRLRRPSPVFASKMCHFIRPDLYVVVDRALVGVGGPYRETWEACSAAWRDAHANHTTLRQILERTAGPLPSTFPFGTKITELCLIGAKASGKAKPRQ